VLPRDRPQKRASTTFADLNEERTELDATIEQTIASMAEVPPERRSAGAWASHGALTKQFLDLTDRQAELKIEIEAVSRAITAPKKPVLPHKGKLKATPENGRSHNADMSCFIRELQSSDVPLPGE
jgi:hypothetical protein